MEKFNHSTKIEATGLFYGRTFFINIISSIIFEKNEICMEYQLENIIIALRGHYKLDTLSNKTSFDLIFGPSVGAPNL